MKFSKQKMIDRVTAEGRADMIDDVVMKIMDNLDGCEGITSNWQRQVYGEPVLWVIGKDETGQYANEKDFI